MDKFNSLTPTFVLILGTMINHVFKEDKDLTTKDFMLMLSPTIPTVLPIIISIIIEICTKISEFFKPKEKDEKMDDLMKEYMLNTPTSLDYGGYSSTNLKPFKSTAFASSYFPAWGNDKTENKVKTNKELLNDSDIFDTNYNEIKIKIDVMFMQLLLSYISNKKNNASYEIDKEIHMKIEKSNDLIETQIWKNIIIPYENIRIKLDILKLVFTDVNDEMLLIEYSKNLSNAQKCKNHTRLIDFISDQPTKEFIKTCTEMYIKKAPQSKLVFPLTSFEAIMPKYMEKFCPRINKVLFAIELGICEYVGGAHIGSHYLASSIQRMSSRSKQINIFGTTLDTDTPIPSTSWGGILSEISEMNELSRFINNNSQPVITNWIKNIHTIGSVMGNEIKHDPEDLSFYITVDENADPETNINQEFKSFVEHIRNIKLLHKSGEKIKIFNTNIEKKEVVTVTPNQAYTDYQEKKELLKSVEKEEKNNIVSELFKMTMPEKELSVASVKTVISAKQINEKYKSFGTTYLRQDDITSLTTILQNFKDEGKLFEEYGLPNKLGILLYGEAGTGKTTTIHAIASYLQKNIYYANLSTVESNEELQMIFDYVMLESINGGIIVFEDIDAMTKVVHDRSTNEFSDDKLTLEYFLNLLQGSLTRDGTIFIATTNHIEKLDPAFYRVGRFDVKINMKKCDHYQIQNIYNKFTHRQIDEEVLNKISEDTFTPAEIIFHLVNYVNSDKKSSDIMEKFF